MKVTSIANELNSLAYHGRGIIIGKSGSMLKRIGTMARREIEDFFGIRATVKLWVKVKEDWRNRQGLIHTFGLD